MEKDFSLLKETQQRVRKNFLSLLAAQILYKILSFAAIMAITRFLGVIDFGKFSFGMSFVWIFLFLSDFGLNELFIRDVSKTPLLLKKYTSTIVILKGVIAIIAFSVIVILAKYFFSTSEKFWIIIFLGAGIILDSVMYFFRCLFRVRETMQREAFLIVAESIIKITSIFAAIKLHMAIPGVIRLAAAIFVFSLVNLLLNIRVFLIYYGEFKFYFNRRLAFKLLKTSLPFALIYMLSMVNFRIDVIMLSLLRGDSAAGIYSAAFRLIEQFFIIPIMLATVYLPVFSKLLSSISLIKILFRRAFIFLMCSSLICFLICQLISEKVIQLIYGASFVQVAACINVLSLVLFPFFIKFLLEKLLYSFNKLFFLCLLYSCAIVMNLFFNFFMIPRFGINGASAATIFCEVFMVCACLLIYRKASRESKEHVDTTIDYNFI